MSYLIVALWFLLGASGYVAQILAFSWPSWERRYDGTWRQVSGLDVTQGDLIMFAVLAFLPIAGSLGSNFVWLVFWWERKPRNFRLDLSGIVIKGRPAQ